MTSEQMKKAAERIALIPQNQVPQPSQLVHILLRDLNMTQLADLVNDGKRNSVYHWREGSREPGWENYVKMLYAAGFKIVKREDKE